MSYAPHWTNRMHLIATVVVALGLGVLLVPAVTSAAGPFKSVKIAGFSPTKLEISGGLDTSKRCLSKRSIRFYGANVVGTLQDLPALGSTTTGRSGKWTKTVSPRDHYVLVLQPKRVDGKRCAGGAYLIEAGGPT